MLSMYIGVMETDGKKRVGAKKKAERLIKGEIVLDLWEPKSVIMSFWVQPSLKDAFTQACQQSVNGPEGPSDVLRTCMLEYLEKHKAALATKSVTHD